jgi:signal transduction histidine kinase
MRGREKRAAEAITAYLAGLQQVPMPRTFASAICSTVGTAIGASGCVLAVGGERYRWGSSLGPASGTSLEQAVHYAGETQGLLTVTPAYAGPVSGICAVLGPPVAMLRLALETDRLRRVGDTAARELVDDRWRATAEMEEERRGLERNLHDGAQHHLVALGMSLAIVTHTAEQGAAGEREELTTQVADLRERLDTAERVLIDTAAGILPAMLASGGLAPALATELTGDAHVVLNLAALRRRYPPQVESAVYFVCLEAVNNARKHAPGARITVTVRDTYRGMEFSVVDTGPGFTTSTPNAGLPNLSERAAAVGGSVSVRSMPGRGTEVTGFVPL